ncbi:C4-dicarboxylate transporter/malic acid transport protein-like protein [Rhexocercosporidium sp. MPI-PUGE-AT-0058]|nr:C4-dicarboxylate transporter/malic acid transport protein-like protein [Rhexocercosporidium sp. MPI-PUGE-AT-0058]
MAEKECTYNPAGCQLHLHNQDPVLGEEPAQKAQTPVGQGRAGTEARSESSIMAGEGTKDVEADLQGQNNPNPKESGFQMIVRNFTPSWFIITMSTGILSIILHQLPYNGDWLQIISVIFFVLNLVLFLLFTAISLLRYTLYPRIFPIVLRHPHQSLFLATFPVGFATLINMTVLVCVPVWGHGMATLAWVLWWIDTVLALTACFHLTYVIMSNQRSELEEMTALYFIPIVSVVIAATSGGIVAGVLPNLDHKLWTLVICYILWGIGSPLSWVILTLYFLRMTVHKPLKREVIVSLLLPIGPLSLSGFSIIVLGKLARNVFPVTHSLAKVADAGNIFYAMGFLVGLILWGFSIVWFVVAVVMISTSGGFPFNMGWWGFIFPIGVFTLLTISIGEELESSFFKVLSCVLTGICVVMWVGISARTVQRSWAGKMFYAPCLGTDLKARK